MVRGRRSGGADLQLQLERVRRGSELGFARALSLPSAYPNS